MKYPKPSVGDVVWMHPPGGRVCGHAEATPYHVFRVGTKWFYVRRDPDKIWGEVKVALNTWRTATGYGTESQVFPSKEAIEEVAESARLYGHLRATFTGYTYAALSLDQLRRIHAITQEDAR